MTSHKELKVWQKGIELVKSVYEVTQSFPANEQFGLVSQMRRAAVSIPSNIAEGSARQSDKETIQFLHISLGSLAELETQLIIAEKLNYIKEPQTYLNKIIEIRSLILGLIKYLKNKK